MQEGTAKATPEATNSVNRIFIYNVSMWREIIKYFWRMLRDSLLGDDSQAVRIAAGGLWYYCLEEQTGSTFWSKTKPTNPFVTVIDTECHPSRYRVIAFS